MLLYFRKFAKFGQIQLKTPELKQTLTDCKNTLHVNLKAAIIPKFHDVMDFYILHHNSVLQTIKYFQYSIKKVKLLTVIFPLKTSITTGKNYF